MENWQVVSNIRDVNTQPLGNSNLHQSKFDIVNPRTLFIHYLLSSPIFSVVLACIQ